MASNPSSTQARERPIIFSTEMVKATLDDLKTMTRRTYGLEKVNQKPDKWTCFGEAGSDWGFQDKDTDDCLYLKCPYGRKNYHLWVKETWKPFGFVLDNSITIHYKVSEGQNYGERTLRIPSNVGHPSLCIGWKSSIFMPHWASRITLEITGIRVERLQDITADDCQREGIKRKALSIGLLSSDGDLKTSFAQLWNFINGKRYPWSSNPWVWCILFRRIK